MSIQLQELELMLYMSNELQEYNMLYMSIQLQELELNIYEYWAPRICMGWLQLVGSIKS